MKCAFHSLIPFFPLFSNCQLRWLDSIQFLYSQAHILAGRRLETQLNLLNWTLFYNPSARTTQKTQPLCCWKGMFTAPLHSNGSYSYVACIFAAGMWSPSRCLAMNIYSDFTIPAFGRHVTVLFCVYVCEKRWPSYTYKNSSIWVDIRVQWFTFHFHINNLKYNGYYMHHLL
jgi:hypothetical protein